MVHACIACLKIYTAFQFSPQRVFVGFIGLREQRMIIFLYNINHLFFVIDTRCFPTGKN